MSKNTLYPKLEDNQSSYRMTEVNRIRDGLETKCESRASLVKKYKIVNKIVEGITGTLTATSVACSVGGTVSASTGIGLFVALPLGVVAGIAGALAMVLEIPRRKFRQKLTKHQKKLEASRSKRNTVLKRTSKFIDDGKIDNDEYTIILNDVSDLDAQLAVIDKTFVNPSAPSEIAEDNLRERIMSLLNKK